MQSRVSERSSQSAQLLPKKQQWAIIYQQRARELQQAKSMEKLLTQQKRDKFKRQLDEQIISKHSVGQAEKEEDKRYYEYIIQQAQQQKEKQERDKFQKYLQLKNLEEVNLKRSETGPNPKDNQKGKIYNIEIGLKSEAEKKQRSEAIWKDVIQTLDKQLHHKEEEKRIQKQHELEEDNRNEQYQNQAFSSRSSHLKKYEQNQNVYNYYRDLYNQKMRKDRELEYKLVDQAQFKKEEEAQLRKEHELVTKQRKNIEMKDTLEKQLELLNYKKNEETKANPQQISYSFIGNMFREKKATFDKKEYSAFLARQAEEQRNSKIQQRFMSEEEYRLNANQLNKAINGRYTHDKYYDRSMGTLGDRVSLNNVDPLHTEDAEIIKSRLDILRDRRNRSVVHSRDDLNDSIA